MRNTIYILSCILFPSPATAQDHIPKARDTILTATENFILPILCQKGTNNAAMAIENCYKNDPIKEKCAIADYTLYNLTHYFQERADIIGAPSPIHTLFFEMPAVNQRLSDFQKSSPQFHSYIPQEFKRYIAISASTI